MRILIIKKINHDIAYIQGSGITRKRIIRGLKAYYKDSFLDKKIDIINLRMVKIT